MKTNSRQDRKRRILRFQSMRDILIEAEKIVRAPHVEQLGNWTPGQIFQHLAKAVRSSIDESKARLPLWQRVIARIAKPFMLRFGLPAGTQIDRVSKTAAKEFLPEDAISNEEGLLQLQQAIAEVGKHKMHARHNIFGKMTQRDWEMMHCRHAELHLSFLIHDEVQLVWDTDCTSSQLKIAEVASASANWVNFFAAHFPLIGAVSGRYLQQAAESAAVSPSPAVSPHNFLLVVCPTLCTFVDPKLQSRASEELSSSYTSVPTCTLSRSATRLSGGERERILL